MSTYEATSAGRSVRRSEPGVANQAGDDAEHAWHREERTPPSRRDRIRWGCVVGGLVVAVSTYLLLQLGLIAVGAVDLRDPTAADAVVSGVVAIVSFFLGGVVAGASAMWDNITDGLLHGILLWAAGLVLLLVLSLAGSGIALGSFDTKAAFSDVQSQSVDRGEASDTAKDVAGKAVAGLVVALIAAAAGGAAGAKMWSGREDREIDLRRRSA